MSTKKRIDLIIDILYFYADGSVYENTEIVCYGLYKLYLNLNK